MCNLPINTIEQYISSIFLSYVCIIILSYRPVKGICGFSRETVIAVTSNIESMELRRRQASEIGYPEHPRAGTSDDVEAFIGLLHRFLGNIFTLKDMKTFWRKIVRYCM